MHDCLKLHAKKNESEASNNEPWRARCQGLSVKVRPIAAKATAHTSGRTLRTHQDANCVPNHTTNASAKRAAHAVRSRGRARLAPTLTKQALPTHAPTSVTARGVESS